MNLSSNIDPNYLFIFIFILPCQYIPIVVGSLHFLFYNDHYTCFVGLSVFKILIMVEDLMLLSWVKINQPKQNVQYQIAP